MTDRVTAEPDVGDRADERADRAGHRPGDPISLADFLALPANGSKRDGRLDRDDRGRLRPMPPDDPRFHRFPMMGLDRWLQGLVGARFWVGVEPFVVPTRIVGLGGQPVPPSALGPQTLRPDLVLFDGRPRSNEPVKGRGGFILDNAAVVIEVISDDTFREDLGLGRADAVDRWRTYLASGVPELWVVNVGVGRPCPLPEGSGLFVRNAGNAWAPLAVSDPVHAGREVNGLLPLTAGRITSIATGVTFDLAALWAATTLD